MSCSTRSRREQPARAGCGRAPCSRPTERALEPVFSPLVPDARFALGVETIYEGYLLHYGRSRLFAPPDGDVALLLGDALLAHGLVRIADTGSLAAVGDVAELLPLCAQARARTARGGWRRLGGDLRAARSAAASARRARHCATKRDPAPLERLARAAAGDDPVVGALAAHVARLVSHRADARRALVPRRRRLGGEGRRPD